MDIFLNNGHIHGGWSFLQVVTMQPLGLRYLPVTNPRSHLLFSTLSSLLSSRLLPLVSSMICTRISSQLTRFSKVSCLHRSNNQYLYALTSFAGNFSLAVKLRFCPFVLAPCPASHNDTNTLSNSGKNSSISSKLFGFNFDQPRSVVRFDI